MALTNLINVGPSVSRTDRRGFGHHGGNDEDDYVFHQDIYLVGLKTRFKERHEQYYCVKDCVSAPRQWDWRLDIHATFHSMILSLMWTTILRTKAESLKDCQQTNHD